MKYLGLIASIGTIVMSFNASYTSALELGTVDSAESCQSTYSADKGTLHVPCLSILNDLERVSARDVSLVLMSPSEPFQLAVTQLVDVNLTQEDEDCQAIYNVPIMCGCD